jgi:hypothetical protein
MQCQSEDCLQAQASQDADYFVANCRRSFTRDERNAVHDSVLGAYRWQYIVSGVQATRFGEVLNGLVSPAQGERIGAALATLM